ncbi:hypothetical protein Z946_3081 [Sulfitobacter noctilucicola]|nr:hypothetical protein Z946_3081 [Sulfitobacter noctilucicola]
MSTLWVAASNFIAQIPRPSTGGVSGLWRDLFALFAPEAFLLTQIKVA